MSQKKIRLIHVIPDLGIGGVQRVVMDICSTCNLELYEVSIFSMSPKKDMVQIYDLPAGIDIRYFQYAYNHRYSLLAYVRDFLFPGNMRKRAKELISAIVQEQPDLLHFHTHFRELPIGTKAARMSGAKIIYTQHLSSFNTHNWRFSIMAAALRRFYRQYHSIAVSEEIHGEIQMQKFNGKNKLCEKIENRLNLNMYTTKSVKHGGINVVYIARITAQKDHATLLQAWAQLPVYDFEVKLYLAGPDNMNGQMQELAQKLGIAGSIDFMGPVNNIPALLAQCDIGVFPSQLEGLPIALLEKMAYALPVIVSDIEALTCVVQDGVDGLVFPLGNADSLAEKMDLIISDTDLRLKLGTKARETIASRFGTSNVAAPNETFYQKVLHLPE